MYRNPANKNYLEAQTLIGVDYLNGDGITQDYSKAIEWFQKAADENFAPAQDMLGFMYNNGHGVNQDHSKACEWFQKSAEQNYCEAQNNLAAMYKDGLGVPQDRIKAVEWFQKSAKLGNADAQHSLNLLNEKDSNITQDDEKALLSTKKLTNQANDAPENKIEQEVSDSEEINSDKVLLVPLRSFFDDYFRDESKRLPLNAGGGVWFPESLSEKEVLKYIDRATKAQETLGLDIPFALGVLNIDTSASQNLQEGIYLHLDEEENGYAIVLKSNANDWDIVVELEKVHYNKSNQILCINNYDVKIVNEVACYYAERFVECMNAYLNQNEKNTEEQTENLYVVTDALDDINQRINDIDEKIVMLLFDEEQELLDSIYELTETLSTIEKCNSDTNDGADFLELMDEFQKSITEISEHMTDMNEREVLLKDEQHIEDLFNNITQRLEAL